MKSVLIVDDDVNLCIVLSEELQENNYNAKYVNSADGAFDFLEKQSVDIILLDLKMPVKDGLYVLGKLKEKKIDSKVIVLTAYADIESAIKTAYLGAVDFLSKPYDIDDLLFAMKKALNQEEHENKH